MRNLAQEASDAITALSGAAPEEARRTLAEYPVRDQVAALAVSGGGNGGASVLEVATATVSSADMEAMTGGTSKQIVAAQGAGTIIVPVFCTFVRTGPAIDLTESARWLITTQENWDGNATDPQILVLVGSNNGLLEDPSNVVFTAGTAIPQGVGGGGIERAVLAQTKDVFDNKPLMVIPVSGDYTGVTSSVLVTTLYYVLTV